MNYSVVASWCAFCFFLYIYIYLFEKIFFVLLTINFRRFILKILLCFQNFHFNSFNFLFQTQQITHATFLKTSSSILYHYITRNIIYFSNIDLYFKNILPKHKYIWVLYKAYLPTSI